MPINVSILYFAMFKFTERSTIESLFIMSENTQTEKKTIPYKEMSFWQKEDIPGSLTFRETFGEVLLQHSVFFLKL